MYAGTQAAATALLSPQMALKAMYKALTKHVSTMGCSKFPLSVWCLCAAWHSAQARITETVAKLDNLVCHA